MSAKEFWDYRGDDFVNKNPARKDNQVARTHQYTLESRNLLKDIWAHFRSNDWRAWMANGFWRTRGLDYVNEDPSTKDNQLARAHQYTLQTRGEVRELKAMVKALAKAQDAGTGKILEAVENAERDAIKITAAEVAKELQAETKISAKED